MMCGTGVDRTLARRGSTGGTGWAGKAGEAGGELSSGGGKVWKGAERGRNRVGRTTEGAGVALGDARGSGVQVQLGPEGAERVPPPPVACFSVCTAEHGVDMPRH